MGLCLCMHSQTFSVYQYVYMNNLCCCLGLVSYLIWFSSSSLEDVHSGCQADPVAHCYRLFGEDGIDHFRVVREPGLQQDRLRSVSVAWWFGAKEGVIIECPLNGLFQDLVTVILTSQMVVSMIYLMMAVN